MPTCSSIIFTIINSTLGPNVRRKFAISVILMIFVIASLIGFVEAEAVGHSTLAFSVCFG